MIADDIWDMLLGKAGKLPGELAPELVERRNAKDVSSSTAIRRTTIPMHSTSTAS